jgi:hypothetical protein
MPVKQVTVTINATLTHADREDIYEDRGADLTVPEGTDMRQVLQVLFAGFPDRLRDAGIKAKNITQFS